MGITFDCTCAIDIDEFYYPATVYNFILDLQNMFAKIQEPKRDDIIATLGCVEHSLINTSAASNLIETGNSFLKAYFTTDTQSTA